ncbi:hypothetical protein LIA77_04360 [Sarocladium implicatum]|nr:hypothetical protein LIA77_04360 [Sarocladium implicatum]
MRFARHGGDAVSLCRPCFALASPVSLIEVCAARGCANYTRHSQPRRKHSTPSLHSVALQNASFVRVVPGTTKSQLCEWSQEGPASMQALSSHRRPAHHSAATVLPCVMASLGST